MICEPPVENQVAHVDLRALREAVGTHFFMWSVLERSLLEAIDHLEAAAASKPAHGISNSLKRWKALHLTTSGQEVKHCAFVEHIFALLSDGLEVRNRLAHGIRGFSIEDGTPDRAFIRTVMNAEERLFTIHFLTSTTDRLGYVAGQLSRMTFAAQNLHLRDIQNIYDDIRATLERRWFAVGKPNLYEGFA